MLSLPRFSPGNAWLAAHRGSARVEWIQARVSSLELPAGEAAISQGVEIPRPEYIQGGR